jgi:hypothetical protein
VVWRGSRRGRRQAHEPGEERRRGGNGARRDWLKEGEGRKGKKGKEGRKEKKSGKEKEGRKEKKKGKEKKKRRKENRNRKRKGKEIGKRFRKLGKLLGKLGVRICGVFRFPGVSVIFGMAVMARRTGRRDRGVRRIPDAMDNRGAGAARVGDGPSAGGDGGIHGTHAEGERGRR